MVAPWLGRDLSDRNKCQTGSRYLSAGSEKQESVVFPFRSNKSRSSKEDRYLKPVVQIESGILLCSNTVNTNLRNIFKKRMCIHVHVHIRFLKIFISSEMNLEPQTANCGILLHIAAGGSLAKPKCCVSDNMAEKSWVGLIFSWEWYIHIWNVSVIWACHMKLCNLVKGKSRINLFSLIPSHFYHFIFLNVNKNSLGRGWGIKSRVARFTGNTKFYFLAL